MKIVYLANSSIPSRTANSIHVMKMCQAFAKNGHEVVLMTPNHANTEQNVENFYDFYDVDACFKIKKILKPRKQIKGLIYQSIVKYLVRSQNPDLVYARCHGLSLYNFSSLGLPIIFEAHRLHKGNHQLAKLIKSKQLKRMIVIADVLRQEYQQQYNLGEALIKVFHDGADEPRNMEKVELTVSQRLQVGYIGHLYPGKGMEIISELARRCQWADFHIVGGLEKDIAYWKKELHNCQNIHFYGFIPPSETNKYRQACDVLIAPYQRHLTIGSSMDRGISMSPLKLFEYMASGKAILASDLSVLKEVLTHSKTAWLCPPEDIESWVIALAYLRDNPDLRNSLGSCAVELFKNKYTWQARAAGIISNLYFDRAVLV